LLNGRIVNQPFVAVVVVIVVGAVVGGMVTRKKIVSNERHIVHFYSI